MRTLLFDDVWIWGTCSPSNGNRYAVVVGFSDERLSIFWTDVCEFRRLLSAIWRLDGRSQQQIQAFSPYLKNTLSKEKEHASESL
jgi:hypothetical protein